MANCVYRDFSKFWSSRQTLSGTWPNSLLYSITKSFKVAGTEGKVGGYFCRLPPLNENTSLDKLIIIQRCHYASPSSAY